MQRAGERRVRALKRECIANDTAVKNASDADTKSMFQSEYQKSAVKLKTAEQQLKDFCKATNQQRDKFREQVLGFDKSQAQKAVWASKKSLTSKANGGIIKSGSNEMAEITKLGKINTQPLEKEFGKLLTDEIIVTNERLEHIKNRHPQDFELFHEYGSKAVLNPDLIIKDCKNKGTVFMVKKLEETNLNVVVRLALQDDDTKHKNSVMTFYRIRSKNLKKLENKNKLLYKKE